MASLATLPVEILDQICTILSPYRRPYIIRVFKPSIKEEPTKHDHQGTRALLNLCQTSKALCKVAQPVVFHTFFDHENYSTSIPLGFVKRLGLFLRTLVERPELAEAVRAIDVDACERKCQCCYPFDEQVKEQMGWISELSARTGLEFNLWHWESREVSEAQLQALLVMVPNLQRLNLRLPVTWDFEALAAWVNRKESETGIAQKFLHTVTHMELGTDTVEANTPRMWEDGERDESFTSSPNPVERLLIEAAPNLELLCCTAGGLDGLPRLPSLTSLQVLLQAPWDGMLPRLIEGLPRLKRFSYSALSDYCPTPAEVQDALLPLRNTLEYLCIRTQGHFPEDWVPQPGRRFRMTPLKDFSALKVLVLDGFAILPHRGVGEMCESDGELFPEFLPPSLAQLHVGGWNSHSSAQFRPLAKAMARSEFPCLDIASWFTGSDADGCFFYALDPTIAAGYGEGIGLPSDVWRWIYDEDSHAFPDWKAAHQHAVSTEYPGLNLVEAQEIFYQLQNRPKGEEEAL
ncbi:hypothetical protein CPLU01_08294 [Colletotrichum plurivorum]|uniref:Uncharacterized protein n=1 Tax=Colletotrichum plurivorum TaxID=2175906 RepID=A0A8H6NDS1_9PEZI|nr:hypothetical protein CPLU01_08294 [Colletotrichum plurivorum]